MGGVEFVNVEDGWARDLRFLNSDNGAMVAYVSSGWGLPLRAPVQGQALGLRPGSCWQRASLAQPAACASTARQTLPAACQPRRPGRATA